METIHIIIIALVFNGLDLLTGIIGAVKNKELASTKLRDGLFKKVGFLFCYFLAWLIDSQGAFIGFDIDVEILPIVVLYACITEAVSIIENITKINPDFLPSKLLELFHLSSEKENVSNGKHSNSSSVYEDDCK